MSLTATEKEQIAVLLGWERCANPDHFGDRWNRTGNGPCEPLWMAVTLEAVMAYCKEQGFSWMLSAHVENIDANVHMWPHSDRLESVATWHPDPLTAMVRATLKAKEATK